MRQGLFNIAAALEAGLAFEQDPWGYAMVDTSSSCIFVLLLIKKIGA